MINFECLNMFHISDSIKIKIITVELFLTSKSITSAYEAENNPAKNLNAICYCNFISSKCKKVFFN